MGKLGKMMVRFHISRSGGCLFTEGKPLPGIFAERKTYPRAYVARNGTAETISFGAPFLHIGEAVKTSLPTTINPFHARETHLRHVANGAFFSHSRQPSEPVKQNKQLTSGYCTNWQIEFGVFCTFLEIGFATCRPFWDRCSGCAGERALSNAPADSGCECLIIRDHGNGGRILRLRGLQPVANFFLRLGECGPILRNQDICSGRGENPHWR